MSEKIEKIETMMNQLNERTMPLNTTTNENDEGIIDGYCQYNEFYPEDDNMDIDLTLEFDVDEGPMDQLKAKK